MIYLIDYLTCTPNGHEDFNENIHTHIQTYTHRPPLKKKREKKGGTYGALMYCVCSM